MNKKIGIILAIILVLVVVTILSVSSGMNRQEENTMQRNVEPTTGSFTKEEVASHNSKNDCWTIISGEVYDLTQYINRHPGGDEILRACGTDATTLFNDRQTTDGSPIGSGEPHSQNARQQLSRLKIGTLVTK